MNDLSLQEDRPLATQSTAIDVGGMVAQIMAAATNPDVDADKAQKMLAMALELQDRQARQLFYQAKARVQVAQFVGQHLCIPAGIQGDTVVRQDVRAALGVAEMRKTYAGDRFQLQAAGRQDSPVSGDDAVVCVNQNRIVESEFLNAAGNLRHLLL